MIAALNTFWRPFTEDYFWNEMDEPMTQYAIEFSTMNKATYKKIFTFVNEENIFNS